MMIFDEKLLLTRRNNSKIDVPGSPFVLLFPFAPVSYAVIVLLFISRQSSEFVVNTNPPNGLLYVY